MSEVTDAMARVNELRADFGTRTHDYVLRAKDAAVELWCEAQRKKLPDSIIEQRMHAAIRAEANRREYALLIQETYA